MSFPFFALPQAFQRDVLRKLDILDVFTFSLLSEEAHSISKSIHKLTFMEWEFEKDTATLHLSETKKRYDSEVAIVVRTRPEGEAVIQTDHRGIRIGTHDVVLKIEREIEGWNEQLSLEYDNGAGTDMYELMTSIWNHIWSLLKRKDEVKHDVSLTNMDLRLAFKALELSKNFNNVDIRHSESELTGDQIKFLFETVSCRCLWIHMKMPRNGAYRNPLNNKYISLDHIEWIELDALLKSHMIRLRIQDDCLADSQLNAILKTWLQGGLRNLQQLRMNIWFDRAHSKDAILDGIPWIPFSERGKPNYSEKDRSFEIERYHSGFDVQRADGMCATLVIDESERGMIGGGAFRAMGSIEFLVWKKKYHMTTDEDDE